LAKNDRGTALAKNQEPTTNGRCTHTSPRTVKHGCRPNSLKKPVPLLAAQFSYRLCRYLIPRNAIFVKH